MRISDPRRYYFRSALLARIVLAAALSVSIVLLIASIALSVTPVENGVTLPLLVWDINYNDVPVDTTPPALTKEQIEAQGKLTEWQRLPIRNYSQIQYITATRQAKVVKEAAGLTDKPLLFTYTENAQPQYGPKVVYQVPPQVAASGRIWRLTFDVAKGNIAISGGIHLWDVTGIEFFEDGTVRAGGVQFSRYAANKPLHIECVIDAQEKTVTVTADGNKATAATIPWSSPKAPNFSAMILHGVLPGGHGEVPSSIAFDNIKLVLEKMR
ncbi:MAG TPA: hypothetical protein VGM23_12060 [Armatimonadota bacterium]